MKKLFITLLAYWLPCLVLAGFGIEVTAYREGETIIVDGEAHVPVTSAEAWAVLNDYDHMEHFIPDLQHSEVIGRSGETLNVSQTKVARFGLLKTAFESIWEIENVPCETIVWRTAGGDLGEVAGTTQVRASQHGTDIHYHGTSIPKSRAPTWLVIGLIESDIRQRLEGMSEEMVRRSKSSPGISAAACKQG